MHKVLVNCLVKLAQQKCSSMNMTRAFDWDVKYETRQAKPIVPSGVNAGQGLKINTLGLSKLQCIF